MGALVKLQGSIGLFQVSSEDKDKVRIHPHDKMCIVVDAGSIINVKDGMEIEDGIIQANQTVIIKPNVSLTPSKYHALVGFNSELSLMGAIVSPIALLVRPREKDKIGLIVRASKKLDISELSHIIELYQID